jgi:putative ABC transport system permease protein
MISVALKGLAGRKVRALLTALAVVIGVSMVSGTFILTDTMQKAFNGIFNASYKQTDAIVSGKQIVQGSTSGHATVSAALLTKVQALPQVKEAGGTIVPDDSNKAELLTPAGKALGNSSSSQFGLAYDNHHPRFSPYKLKSGAWPRGPSQVVIDAGTAKKHHVAVGQAVDVKTLGQVRHFRVSGIATYGDVDSLGGATMAIFDLPTAQTLLHKQGRFDAIWIAATDGVAPHALVRAVQPLVPSDLEVKGSADQAKADSKDTNKGLNIVRYFLLGFGGIALFVGAFVIFNTLSITVAQRTREFATLRTLGASRRQVMRSVVLEGFMIGLLASLLGLLAGYGIYKGMNALFVALGVDLPKSGTVVAARTVIVSLLLGTIVTLVASIMPALRATRVPPIAAVREGAELPASRFAAHSLKAAVAVIGASVAAIATSVFAPGLGTAGVILLLGLGVISLFLGVALLAPRLVKPLARLVAWPARRAGGVAGELAEGNAIRNPGRTASTAAALMVGLTLVTVVAVLGAGLRHSVESAASDQVTAAFVLDGNNGEPFAAAEGAALARVDGVRTASQVRSDQALVQGKANGVTGVEPATIARFYHFKWMRGSEQALRRLGRDGAIVIKKYADANHLRIGSRLHLATPSGTKRTVVVRGIYKAPEIDQLLGEISIDRQSFDAAFPQPKNSYTFIDAGSGAHNALKAASAHYNDATFHTGAAFAKDYTKGFATFLNLLYVLLAFSVVVSLFGMVNTLVLSVHERTRELGMLRTIGMTRRQARRMIRHESVITALIGAAMGLPLGIFLAGLVTQALSKYGVGLSLPVPTLAGFTAVSILAGIAAAVIPARRASRLNVLDALHYE